MEKLSEILEECIEARLAGRRSLEVSLALYPAQAEELEPLLRIALGVSDSFQSCTPPAAIEQRIRSRFLADAAARRNLRHLEGSFEKRGWLSGLFRRPVFAGLAAAAAVANVVAITVGRVNLGGGDDGGSLQLSTVSPAVSSLGNRVESISDHLESGGQIQSADLAEILALLDQLSGATPEELRESAAELEAILPGMLEIFRSSDGTPGTAAVQAVIEKIDTASRDIAKVLGFDLPDPIVVGAATPAPTDAPVEPTDVRAEGTPAPTGGSATVAPTATPPPPPSTRTADDRAPGFSPKAAAALTFRRSRS